MSHDVFLSHSNLDKRFADAACAYLEQAGIRCWIAPRDILPGQTWAGAIIEAISDCSILVLIFSQNANASNPVITEVERAVNKERVILPFRIDKTIPTGDMEFFLSRTHWLDALTPQLDQALSNLVTSVRSILDLGIVSSAKPANITGQDERLDIGPTGRMVLIPEQDFMMGSNLSEEDQRPAHRVHISRFWIAPTPVTNHQYAQFVAATGHRPAPFVTEVQYSNPLQPVVGISWLDAQACCTWMGGRLPTEAEWEAAARGGSGLMFGFDGRVDREKANYGNLIGFPQAVAKYPPNPYALFDMSGNVWEWCCDWYEPNYYQHSPIDNPTGPLTGTARVLRGGSWNSLAESIACSYRGSNVPTQSGNRCYGFRLARSRP